MAWWAPLPACSPNGGLFAFSVERLAGGDFALQLSRRYAHSDSYVRRTLEANGLSVLALEPTTIRQDRREPIKGLGVVAGSLTPFEACMNTIPPLRKSPICVRD